MNAEELKVLLKLLRDARWRIANKAQEGAAKADFLRLDKPVLDQLDAQIIKIEARLVTLTQREQRSRRQQSRNEAFTLAIVAAFESGANYATWDEIKKEVELAGVKVNNWEEVRKVLQNMVDTGYAIRTAEIHREIYQRVKK